MIQTDGEIYHVPVEGKLVIWKWLYYRKQYTDSMQFLSNYQWYFHRTRVLKKIHNMFGNTNDPE